MLDFLLRSEAAFVEWVQKAVWDVKGVLGDKDAKSHADALREVNSQKTETDREIYKAVESQRVRFGGIIGTVKALVESAEKGFTNLLKTLSFILRNFPLVLIVAGIVFLIYYFNVFGLFKRVKSA